MVILRKLQSWLEHLGFVPATQPRRARARRVSRLFQKVKIDTFFFFESLTATTASLLSSRGTGLKASLPVQCLLTPTGYAGTAALATLNWATPELVSPPGVAEPRIRTRGFTIPR